jgi:hypothetical protein
MQQIRGRSMRKVSLAIRVVATLRRTVAASGALLLGAGLAGPAIAQCRLVSGPIQFTCPGCYGNLNLRPVSISQVFQKGAGGPDRIMIPLNYGHAVYSLSSPAAPQFLGLEDIRTPPPSGVGPIDKDGQSFIAGTQASVDGQRALLTMDVTGYGNTIVGKPSGDIFRPAGDTGSYRSSGLVIQKSGSRYIGYGLGGSSVWAADLTTLPPSGFALGNMPSEVAFPGLTTGATGLQFTTSPLGGNTFQYIYFFSRSSGSVVVADVSSPGPAGSITANDPTWTIPLTAWGRPSGDSLQFVSAAVDPQSVGGNLYILGAFSSSSGVPGFSLLQFERLTGQTTQAGSFSPDPAFNRQAGGVPVLAVANPYGNNVDLYMWAAAPGPTINGSRGILRLYATSAHVFGAAIGQTVDFDMNLTGVPLGISGMDVLRKSDTDVYAYVTDATKVYAMKMDCVTGPAPATARLAVSDVSGSAPVTLESGATVFLGERLRIVPSVLPSSSIEPVDQWNLDLNYHELQETASGLLKLHTPDATGSGDPSPSSFTLVGPCDRNFASGDPATGANCWASVTPPSGNGTFGGPDFVSSPSPGVSATLPIAFEAKNHLNDSQSPPNLARFDIVWKVPSVKPLGLTSGVVSALLDANNKATFQDSSEGHPVANGYRWYFGSSNGAPQSETLGRDAACTGPSCTHTFPAGQGTYNAFLAAAYDGGYSSPDCGLPCTLPRPGSFVVSVTGFVAAFTASTSASVGGSPINVTNQSQIGPGVTPVYRYSLCDASGGSCADGTYTQLSGGGPWTIPVPATAGTWWLRIRATYGSGPTTVQWLPGVLPGHPDAWPIDVQQQPPVLKPTGQAGVDGWNWCTVGCGPIAYLGTVGTPLTVAVFRGSTQQSGSFDWTTSGACTTPGSDSGEAAFSFTPQSAGTLTVNNPTLGVSLRIQISGSLKVTVPSTAGAGSPNLIASVPDHADSTYAWAVTNGTITAGQGTRQITFTAGVAGTPLILSVTETTAGGCQTSGSASLTVTPGASALRFYTVTPCRMLDTRSSSPIAPGGTSTATLTGAPCNVPSSAAAVSVNITVTQPAAAGYLTVYPADRTLPFASSINFKAGQTRANNAILSLAGDGSGGVKVFGGGTGTVQVIIDVNGYFR